MSFDKRVLVASEVAEKVLALAEGVATGCRESPGYNLYKRILRARVYEILGHGYYGVALRLPDGNVLKVALCEEDGYPMYAQWAQRNPGDHIPEIYYTCRVHANFFVAAMPTYEELEGDNEMAWGSARTGDNSSLAAAFEKVRAATNHLARSDEHAGNGMWCPRRQQIVITDPVAGLTRHDCYTSEAQVKGVRTVQLLGEQMDWINEESKAERMRRATLDFDWRMQVKAREPMPQAVLQIPKDWAMPHFHKWTLPTLGQRCIGWTNPAMQQELAMRKHGLAAKDFDKLRPDLQARVKLNAKRWPNAFAR